MIPYTEEEKSKAFEELDAIANKLGLRREYVILDKKPLHNNKMVKTNR